MTHSPKSEFLFASSENAYLKLKEGLEQYDQWVLLMDENTEKKCKSEFLHRLDQVPNLELSITPGEHQKNLDVCQDLWAEMMDKNMTRNTALVNLGGGLISDLGGYVAACYKRGIDFYNVPTTLLAMVDAAYGGKTAVNFNGIKNQIGIFKNAKCILFDTIYLQTLPETQLISGFAEILKHALIDDSELWKTIRSRDQLKSEDLDHYINRSIQIKTNITDQDPLEQNIRKKLNFGHSIGHAFESILVDDDRVFHGQAIAAGMICEAYISVDLGLLERASLNEIESVILNHFGKLSLNEVSDKEILKCLSFDKKNHSAKLNFTLISDIGSSVIDQSVPEDKVIASLKHYRQLA